MNSKISVIMPSYNVENYISRSINSVINQTFGFENIELIIIDDCSTDNTKEIIKDFSSKYNNIIPIFLKKIMELQEFQGILVLKKLLQNI